jgi:DNA polymerase-3 subunit alpha
MKSCEKAGLLKIDFLGLRTLTVLHDTVRLIREERGETIDLAAIPLDDAETFRLRSAGNTVGVFQLGVVRDARFSFASSRALSRTSSR